MSTVDTTVTPEEAIRLIGEVIPLVTEADKCLDLSSVLARGPMLSDEAFKAGVHRMYMIGDAALMVCARDEREAYEASLVSQKA